jgi:hypothetical protein
MADNRGRKTGNGAALVSFIVLMQFATAAVAIECDRDQVGAHTLDGEVIAFSGIGGSQSIKLDRNEEVLESASKGCVAMVSTNRRLLVISALASGWTSVRYQVNESPAHELKIGDFVAFAISDKRVIGYDSTNKRVVTTDISAREAVAERIVGSSVMGIATDRRVIGFSVGLTNFVERSLQLHEEVKVIDSTSDIVTVITPNRILTLRLGSGTWAERSRAIR